VSISGLWCTAGRARLDGLEQALQEGRAAMREAAKQLRESGVSDEAIQKATGLGPEDLG